ncbi:MAG TPA: HAD family hydrolase [Candidatus Eisenbacteria bacterium]
MFEAAPDGAVSSRHRRPDVLLLDFGGTLDADGVHWVPRLLATYREQGGEAPAPEFDAAFHDGHQAFGASPGIRSLGFRETVHGLTEAILRRLPDAGRVDAARVAERFRVDAAATAARNLPILERLARRHRVAAISNFTGNLEPCLEELGLLHCFDAVVDSGRFGVAKPDERIFAEGLRALGANGGNAWMVGDNPVADIAPALRMGLRACWVAPAEREFPLPEAPTARVPRFVDLESALASCTD